MNDWRHPSLRLREREFERRFGRLVPVRLDPTDGGEVSPPGFMDEVREMDAKWARGEYPIQKLFNGLRDEAHDPDETDPGLNDPSEPGE